VGSETGTENLQLAGELELRHFEQMEAIELAAYGAEFVAPAREAWEWHRALPSSTVALAAGDEVVGFVNLFPVRPEVFGALRAGRYNDAEMTAADLVDPRGETGALHMFLSCIAVGEGWRGRGVADRLLKEAVRAYADVEGRCAGVACDTVTDGGARLARRYGLRPLGPSDHGSAVFAGSYQAFAAAVRARSSR
jgi:GNAT superfamily N-acetyltransferase